MTATATATVRRTPLARALLAQARMELVLMLRSGESLLVTIGAPLGLLVFFSLVDVLPTGERDPVAFLVPGVLAISVMATGLVALGIQTAFERKYLVLKRLGATPLPRWGLLAGKFLAVAAVLLGQVALVLGVAAVGLGWEPGGAVVVLVLGLLLGTVTFCALGLLLAGTLRAEATLAFANGLFLVLLLVSGLAFEAETLPEPLAGLGRALPSGALGTVLRDALDGTVATAPLAVLAVWAAVFVGLAARFFRWEG